MKYNVLLVALLCGFQSFAQRDFYAEGDALILSGQFSQAEALFREAAKTEPTNYDYVSQLGVCLLQQGKLVEAEEVLQDVLKKDATNSTALWYIGVTQYSSKKYPQAIAAFEKVLPLLDSNSVQYPSAFWFIGKSHSAMLKTSGITSKEADRMFQSYYEYIRLLPDAPDVAKIRNYLNAVSQNRPAQITDKWIAQ